ncbi:hypothetical protein D3C73_1257270 [compost metagenome]
MPQAVQHGVDLADGFQQDGLRLGGNGVSLGLLRQRFQPGAFQDLAADVIHQRALSHRCQKTARLPHALQLRHRRRGCQQAHEGVLRQVSGFGGHAQAPSQPTPQPPVVVAVEQAQLAVLQRFQGRHDGSAIASQIYEWEL